MKRFYPAQKLSVGTAIMIGKAAAAPSWFARFERGVLGPSPSLYMEIRRRYPLLQGMSRLFDTFYFSLATFLPSTIDAGVLWNRRAGQSWSTCNSGRPDLWRYWARLCSEAHVECNGYASRQRVAFSPERRVEIFPDPVTGEAVAWKVVTNLDTSACSYLALSHCWGSIRHIELTELNHSRLFTQCPVSELPKTYQDAMNISLSMRSRYIWIDSLCIIQDNKEYWKQQSSVMGLIYKYATCNIAATWARDGNGGCFSSRDPADIDLWTIELPIGPAGEQESTKMADFRIVPMFAHFNTLNRAVLNSRGWVMQERYLSPRQLQFTRDEVCWECSELVASERFPMGIPDSMHDHDQARYGHDGRGKPGLNHGTLYDLRQSWVNLVNIYSNTRLSVFTDRPAAIACLARELRERLGDEYLAGLWRNDLVKQLCWRASYGNPRAEGVYLAPNWSWFSIHGRIRYDTDYWDPERDKTALYLAQVIAVSVSSSHPSGLHSFELGSLQIRALGMWCRVLVHGQLGNHTAREELVEAGHPNRGSAGSPLARLLLGGNRRLDLLWDEENWMPSCPQDQDEEHDTATHSKLMEMRQGDLLFVFISCGGWRHKLTDGWNAPPTKGLVIAQASHSENDARFVRLGLFRLYRSDFLEDPDSELDDILMSRLGLEADSESLPKEVDLGDARPADMVHTVTIIGGPGMTSWAISFTAHRNFPRFPSVPLPSECQRTGGHRTWIAMCGALDSVNSGRLTLSASTNVVAFWGHDDSLPNDTFLGHRW